jgi:hypothetical protein
LKYYQLIREKPVQLSMNQIKLKTKKRKERKVKGPKLFFALFLEHLFVK